MAVILVVDDERTIAETIAELLTWEGHVVHTASDGLRALELLDEHRPALLVIDFMMPVMDGIETLRRIRASKVHARLPVILMTAAPLSLPREEDAPRWDYLLVKPFTARDLGKAMQQVLGKKR